MTKIKVERAKKIVRERIKKLVEEKKAIFCNNSGDEARYQRCLIENEIALLECRMKELNGKEKENKIYGTAKIIMQQSNNPYEKRQMNVVIMDCSGECDKNHFVVSKEALIACAIMKCDVGSVASYKVNGTETFVTILEKNII